MSALEFHPIANIFPLLAGEELEALADDIREHGLREEIMLFEGKILDGRNRNTACVMAGVKPRTREFKGTRMDALAYVWSENFHRRHLAPGPAAGCVELKKRQEVEFEAEVRKLEEKGRAKQREGAKQGGKTAGRGRPKQDDRVPQRIGEGNSKHARETATKLAKTFGTNRTYLHVAAKQPVETLEAIRDGKVKMPDLIREEKRATIVKALESTAAKEAKALSGVYDVIVIDPPWPMQKIDRDERPNQCEFDYPTMTETGLAMLPIPAADDCHVWLWATHKFLPMALRLLEVWGLKYVCTFVWHKPGGFQPIGLPQYNCEFALYARKGTPQFIDTKALNTCFQAPRTKHSEKPEAFYDVLRRVTAGRRADIFNRRKIEGFDGFGLEAPQ